MLFQFGKNYFLSRVICGRDTNHLLHAKQPCGALMQREFRNFMRESFLTNFFSNLFSGRIEEEQEKGTLVAFVNAQDADHGNNGKVQLRLLDSSRSFDLDENGKLTTKRVLDREIQDSFKMTIEACDQGVDARYV